MNKTLSVALAAGALAAAAASAAAQGHWHGGHGWHGGHTDVGVGLNFVIPVEPAPAYHGPRAYDEPVAYGPARHIYYYYPWAHVYYAPWQDGYYYVRGDRWVFTHVQPRDVRGGGPAVRLSLAANSPIPYDDWVTDRYGG
jgi:hypothetical protein